MITKRTIALFAFIILLCLTPTITLADFQGLKVIFMDVNQGDAALLQCGSDAMLIDTGSPGAWSHIREVMEAEYINSLKYIVATHPHQDHIGNVARTIEAYPVDTVVLPPIEWATQAYARMIEAIRSHAIPILYPQIGDTISLGDATITVYAPYPVAYSNPNDWSICLMVTYADHRILFCADAEYEAERDMLAANDKYSLKADVLKVAHHGSDTSSSYAFIQAVSPSIAVVSCGDTDEYPSTDVAMTLIECGAEIRTTKAQGDIVIAYPSPSVFCD